MEEILHSSFTDNYETHLTIYELPLCNQCLYTAFTFPNICILLEAQVYTWNPYPSNYFYLELTMQLNSELLMNFQTFKTSMKFHISTHSGLHFEYDSTFCSSMITDNQSDEIPTKSSTTWHNTKERKGKYIK